MNIPSWLPPVLTFAAAILAGIAGFLQSKIQSQKSSELKKVVEENRDLTKKVADNDGRNRELIQDIAARSGNQKELRDLIETRSRLLSVERSATESLIDDVIAQAPEKAKDYRSMKDAKTERIDRRKREYLLSWEPLFQFVIASFDHWITELKRKGIQIEVQQNDVPFAQSGSNASYYPRIAQHAGLRLDMQLNNAGIDVEKMDDAYFFIRLVVIQSNQVEIEPLVLRIGEKSANCGGKDYASPPNGIPPKELTDAVQIGIGKAVERLLVISQSEKRL